MTFLLSLFNQFKAWIIIALSAISGLFLYTQKVKHDTKKKMQKEIEIYNNAVEKQALIDRIKRDEDISNTDDSELIRRLSESRKNK